MATIKLHLKLSVFFLKRYTWNDNAIKQYPVHAVPIPIDNSISSLCSCRKGQRFITYFVRHQKWSHTNVNCKPAKTYMYMYIKDAPYCKKRAHIFLGLNHNIFQWSETIYILHHPSRLSKQKFIQIGSCLII